MSIEKRPKGMNATESHTFNYTLKVYNESTRQIMEAPLNGVKPKMVDQVRRKHLNKCTKKLGMVRLMMKHTDFSSLNETAGEV